MIYWKRTKSNLDQTPMPSRKSHLAAGFDLQWQAPMGDIRSIHPGEAVVLATGWCVKIPPNMVGLIRDRSGLALMGLTTRAGVIDADYRGEVMVVMCNESNDIQNIHANDRIAQMIIVPCWTGAGKEVDELDTTERGDRGFGSTGR